MDSLRLRRWTADDIDLLHAANTPEMTVNLNGPETEQQIDERNARYLRLGDAGEARMFVIIDDDDHRLGSIGYWHVDWRGEPSLETGWFVLPEAQGHGVASRALALLIDDVREHRRARRYLTAFPAVGNAGSNGVCRRGGFAHVGVLTETFREADLIVNEWVLDLTEG
ncbi:GNAT family N-acetyltransferase [Microbacterium sp. H1-D42]|uniref:GNAT family N-acetyltransferase n=1 Tax=Microbacterium sp. H1-D42 TaxID=2925844 RepID=UPI001F531128|nr:GNAT family N-acetyltransferase [Microbacterium sp. H1-D42]UNK71845.1 GNAT family N-acetyltransferase [Microbacterium sp. H1-D42]